MSLPWRESHPPISLINFTPCHPGLITTKAPCCSNHFPSFTNLHFIQEDFYFSNFLKFCWKENEVLPLVSGNQSFLTTSQKISPILWSSKFWKWESIPNKSSETQTKPHTHKGVHCSEVKLLNGSQVTSNYDILLRQKTGYSTLLSRISTS